MTVGASLARKRGQPPTTFPTAARAGATGPRVAVIGSGFAGLAAATVLADAGSRVVVLEKNATIGGRARSFSAEGLTFDMGPSWYWMPEIFEEYFNRFGQSASDFYDLVRLDPSFSICFGDGELMDVPASTEELVALFESLEPGSGPRLRAFLDEAAFKYQVGMREMAHMPGRSLLEFARWRVLGALFRMNLFKSFHAYVRGYFRHPKLIRLLEFPILFLGGTPATTPALYSLMNHAELRLGTWYPMGGMHRIIDGMREVAEAAGVEIITGAPVSRIAVDGGLARGLELDGASVPAEAVVAAADYHHVEQQLLEPDYRRYDESYWSSRVLAPSALIYYLGVRGRVDGLRHHTLFFDEDLDGHARDLYDDQRWPERPLFYVCAPSRTDPSVAPPDCENLFVLVPVAPGLHEENETADRYYDLVMERIERQVDQPLRSRVFYRRSYGVRDFQTDYNALRGNAYGLANTLRQTALLKPSMNSPKVANLFFAGQLTVPGPGVPPTLISGQIAAKQAARYLGVKRA